MAKTKKTKEKPDSVKRVKKTGGVAANTERSNIKSRPIRSYRINLGYDKERYTQYAKTSSKLLYWLTLLALGVFNFMIFIALMPFMLVLGYEQLLLIIAAIGVLFGIIFCFIVDSLEHLGIKHHVFAAIFIPLLAVINIFLLVSFGMILRGVSEPRGRTVIHASLLYVAMFALPYLIKKGIGAMSKRKK